MTAAEKGAAGSWTDWEYSKLVVVKENSGQTLTDFQVLLNLSGGDFPAGAKADGSDLRFVNAGGEEEELSYWLESFDAENETGKVWVKVPDRSWTKSDRRGILSSDITEDRLLNINSTDIPVKVKGETIWAQPDKLPIGTIYQGSIIEANFMIRNAKEIYSIDYPPWITIRKIEYNKYVSLSVNTSEIGDFLGEIEVDTDGGNVTVPISVSIRNSPPPLAKLLITPTPFDICSTSDGDNFNEMTQMFSENYIDVNYIDYDYIDYGIPQDLSDYDVILIAEITLKVISDTRVNRLQDFIDRGGIVIVCADYFYVGTVAAANKIIEDYGLKMKDEEVSGEVIVKGDDIVPDKLTEGVGELRFWRPSPVYKTGCSGKIVVKNPSDSREGFVARSSSVGDVIVLGESLWWNYLATSTDYDNSILFGNMVTYGWVAPTVSITTDESEYTPGETMTVTIVITNPTEESVTYQWYWIVPQFSVCIPVMSFPVLAGSNDTLNYTYTIPDWGATTFGNVFYVQLLGGGAGGEVLDADAGCWIYNPSGEAISQTELAEQIKKTLQDFEARAPAATTSTTSTSTATKKLPKGWPTDSQSTTGPEPPAGLAGGAAPQTLDYEVVISEVPAYEWHRGCGPTAAGMIIGYWDGQGFDDLVSGDAATQTTAVNDAISSSGNYDDYCLPLDYYPAPILPDRSEPPVGDEHADDCVADFMKTSQSFHRNYYGWSWYSAVDDALLDYVQSVAPQYRATARNDHWGVFTWASFRAEIDANRPVELLVDTNGDGKTDHFVTAVGYGERGSTPMYACLNTWDEAIHWFEFAQMSAGQQWGIYGATIFSLEQNEAEAAVSISTDEFKYSPGETLTATIKIANPSEEDLTFQWFWAVPQFSICVPVLSFPVAAGYDETHDFNFTIPNWGATPFGNLFFVQLLDEDSGGEVWDLDAACWAYSPRANRCGCCCLLRNSAFGA